MPISLKFFFSFILFSNDFVFESFFLYIWHNIPIYGDKFSTTKQFFKGPYALWIHVYNISYQMLTTFIAYNYLHLVNWYPISISPSRG